MVRSIRNGLGLAIAASLAVFSNADVRAEGPYTADANTIGLYHFDELPGSADPGNPFANFGTAGATLNMTNTGGPDGRDNAGGGGYGATSYSGYGSAFNAIASGNNAFNSTTSTTGGGATTAGTLTQAGLQGANGAFTYEALVNLRNNTTEEQNILSHDGSSNRGFLFRVTGGKLSFYNGAATATTLEATIPTSGSHAFDASKWYHVAITYDGAEGAAANTRFYWTAMDSGATQANLIGTGILPADLTGAANLLGIGTTTRSPFRFEMELIDELRISSIAREPTDFIMIPEPTSLGLLLAAGGLLLSSRRQRV